MCQNKMKQLTNQLFCNLVVVCSKVSYESYKQYWLNIGRISILRIGKNLK